MPRGKRLGKDAKTSKHNHFSPPHVRNNNKIGGRYIKYLKSCAYTIN